MTDSQHFNINDDEPLVDDQETQEEDKRPQANVLLQLAEEAKLFRGPDGTAYADLMVKGHRETWPVRKAGFRSWLSYSYYKETGKAASSNAMQSALAVVEARAQFDSPEMKTHVRVAGHGGHVYLDLVDKDWRAVEMGPDGWRIVATPPVRFRRAGGMMALPEPRHGGNINDLRRFLNITDDGDFVLAVAWLLAALRDKGPYPIMVMSGEAGSAKSTLSSILRRMVDPNAAPQRSLPLDIRDLFVAANNSYALYFDNVSRLPHWLSDALCRLSTGGGFATRALYTDEDEKLFDAMRPIILNGVEDNTIINNNSYNQYHGCQCDRIEVCAKHWY